MADPANIAILLGGFVFVFTFSLLTHPAETVGLFALGVILTLFL